MNKQEAVERRLGLVGLNAVTIEKDVVQHGRVGTKCTIVMARGMEVWVANDNHTSPEHFADIVASYWFKRVKA